MEVIEQSAVVLTLLIIFLASLVFLTHKLTLK